MFLLQLQKEKDEINRSIQHHQDHHNRDSIPSKDTNKRIHGIRTSPTDISQIQITDISSNVPE